jgi:hypothetical protein
VDGAGATFCSVCSAGTYLSSFGITTMPYIPIVDYSASLALTVLCSGASACVDCTAASCKVGQYLSGCRGVSAGSCATCPAGGFNLIPGKFCPMITVFACFVLKNSNLDQIAVTLQ